MNKETENNKETEKKILNTDSELDQVHDFGGYKKTTKKQEVVESDMHIRK